MCGLGVTGIFLIIQATKNNLFFLHEFFNRARITLVDGSFILTIPSTRNIFFFHGMACSTGRLSFPSQSSCLFNSMLSICKPLLSHYLWNKGHIGYVIAATSINTNHPMISSIHHYCLWSFAPASTLVKVKLLRAPRSYCPPRGKGW